MKRKFKYELYYYPNYNLLQYVTKRKDAVALRAWNYLHNLFIQGKEGLGEFKTRRAKRWRTKMIKVGLIYLNSYSGRWRLSQKGLDIVSNRVKI